MLEDLTHSFRIDPADLPSEEVIFGGSAALREVRRHIDRALNGDLSLLIQGESGTGKELIAKYLHVHSKQAGREFVKLNSVELTQCLLGAEIPGLADAGTLFLDEIGDMDSNLQRQLVRSLASRGSAEKAGSLKGPKGARVVCSMRIGSDAVNEATEHNVDGSNDLVCLRLPALRDRKQDIPLLSDFLMQKQARRFGKSFHQLTPETLEVLSQWQWPGNIRELENWVARVVILGNQQAVAEELRKQIALYVITDDAWQADKSGPRLSSDAIWRALHAQGLSSRRRAVQDLRVSYRALLSHLRDAELSMPRKRRTHCKDSPPIK
jgi:DNA-binding NtrC family response regulator